MLNCIKCKLQDKIDNNDVNIERNYDLSFSFPFIK